MKDLVLKHHHHFYFKLEQNSQIDKIKALSDVLQQIQHKIGEISKYLRGGGFEGKLPKLHEQKGVMCETLAESIAESDKSTDYTIAATSGSSLSQPKAVSEAGVSSIMSTPLKSARMRSLSSESTRRTRRKIIEESDDDDDIIAETGLGSDIVASVSTSVQKSQSIFSSLKSKAKDMLHYIEEAELASLIVPQIQPSSFDEYCRKQGSFQWESQEGRFCN